MLRLRKDNLLLRRRAEVMKSSIRLDEDELMNIVSPVMEQEQREQQLAERVFNDIAQAVQPYQEEFEREMQQAQQVDEQFAKDIADYFMDNIKIDDRSLRELTMKRQPAAMRSYEITYNGSTRDIEGWFADNIDGRVNDLNRDVEGILRDLERDLENVGRKAEDLFEDAGGFVKGEILNNVSTDPEGLLDFLDVKYNETTVLMERSEAATSESNSVFVGVGAGVVGAVAAAALFAACNNKKQIAANEEAFIRA